MNVSEVCPSGLNSPFGTTENKSDFLNLCGHQPVKSLGPAGSCRLSRLSALLTGS